MMVMIGTIQSWRRGYYNSLHQVILLLTNNNQTHNAPDIPALVQTTPASWLWSQVEDELRHSARFDSVPVHDTFDSKTSPIPPPYWAQHFASKARRYPSILHTTEASTMSQLSSQIVPHEPFIIISTRPWVSSLPPSSRTSNGSATEFKYNSVRVRLCLTFEAKISVFKLG